TRAGASGCPGPALPVGVAPASLDPWTPHGPGFNARVVVGLGVDKPASRFVITDRHPTRPRAHGEVTALRIRQNPGDLVVGILRRMQVSYLHEGHRWVQ